MEWPVALPPFDRIVPPRTWTDQVRGFRRALEVLLLGHSRTHAMRWIWIDRFEEFHSRESAVAMKLVSAAEDHLYGPFPEYPVMPHSLILEGLAQTGGVLLGEANNFAEKVVLAKITSAKFHGHAIPGDVLRYEAKLVDVRPEGGVTECRVLRNGELMAEAEIFFAHLGGSLSGDSQSGQENFVFTKGHLLSLLQGVKGTYEATSTTIAKN